MVFLGQGRRPSHNMFVRKKGTTVLSTLSCGSMYLRISAWILFSLRC
uniref:Uncharacterized protein n=1 Tax=Arundo donax TaxID=35708 RepID=A0A0A9B4Q7_ARUDO